MPGPNLLVILTDQQRADTVHALGNPVIRTPALDRLCAEGTAFTRAITPSPVCVPARACLSYGQYPQHTHCYDNGDPMPEDGRPSFADALAGAGYRTHAIGKCHFTPDLWASRGFQTRERQEEIVARPEEDDYLRFLHAQGFAHVCDPHGIRGEMYYVPQPSQMPAALHPTQWVGDRAVAFVTGQAGSARPWLLSCHFIHPHPPFAPPNPWHKLYHAPLMPLPHLPPEAEALHTAINRRQNRYKYRDRGFDLNLVRGLKAYYYAAISFVDYQVGRLLRALEKSGQLDRTLIVFTSDHGELLGDYGCFGKRSMHEACLAIPLLARLPGRFAPGGRCSTPASLVDVMPTLLAAAGVEAPAARDGEDLAVLAEQRGTHRTVFSQYQRAGRAIYTLVEERWKYAYSAADDREFLFDRVQDPGETHNLAALAPCAATRRRLCDELIGYLREAGETEALAGDAWRSYPHQEMPTDPDAGLLIQDHPWADPRLPGYTDSIGG